MDRNVLIVVAIIFGVFFGVFTWSEVPVAITEDEVLAAVDDAIAETNLEVDRAEVQQVVNKSIENLKARQSKRLKYLVSAYFIMWFIFIVYALRLSQTQSKLRKRLDQLQAGLETHGTE